MPEEKSLLEQAKAVYRVNKSNKKYTDEEIELVQAWLNSEISLDQLTTVLKRKKANSVYSFIALCLRFAHQKNGHKK